MKIGFTFTKGTVKYTVLAITENGDENVALLLRENKYDPYVTVWNLCEDKAGSCSWYYGHYISNFNRAVADYNKRRKQLLG